MTKKKTGLLAPRYEYWRAEIGGDFKYHTIGGNGKNVGGHPHEGFTRFENLRDNIILNAEVVGVNLKYKKIGPKNKSGDGYFIHLDSDLEIPLIRIQPPEK